VHLVTVIVFYLDISEFETDYENHSIIIVTLHSTEISISFDTMALIKFIHLPIFFFHTLSNSLNIYCMLLTISFSAHTISSGYSLLHSLVFIRLFPVLINLYVLHHDNQDLTYKKGLDILKQMDDEKLLHYIHFPECVHTYCASNLKSGFFETTR